MKSITFIFISLSTLLFSCKKHEISTPTFNNYNRQGLLQNIGNNIIIPSYNNLVNSATNLHNACITFNSNPNQVNLDSLQSKWRQTASAWKKCEVFRFGPSAEIGQSYYANIDTYPNNSTDIENNLFTASTIDSTFIANKGTSVKGLPALEYLLFDRTNGDSYILNKFTGVDYLTQKRKEYLSALTINIKGKTKALYNSWITSNGNYITTFIANDGNGLSSSIGYLVNELSYLIEIMKNDKLNVPLGSKNSGVAQPNAVEAAQSESSINHLKDNLNSIENAYLGNGSIKTDSTGFDDLLKYLAVKSNDTLLTQKIKLQFANTHAAINAIEAPMQNAVTNNPKSLQTASEELKKLLALFKIDMATALGITITFNLNDGD